MRTSFAFWDTSALIPLCYRQDSTRQAFAAKRRFETTVIWWGTPVEVHSGIDRLTREALLDERGRGLALGRWLQLYNRAKSVTANDDLLVIATGLPRAYNLRTLDSFQLAAALRWCGERPRNRPFVSADNRLSTAAASAGFDVELIT